MTRLQARQILRDHGMTLISRNGEYNVDYSEKPDGGIWTFDLIDAVDAGIAMRQAVNAVYEEAI